MFGSLAKNRTWRADFQGGSGDRRTVARDTAHLFDLLDSGQW